MDILKTFFADHLAEDEEAAAGGLDSPKVARMTSLATRYVLFKVGQIRFALPSTDVASVTRAPDSRCEYVSGGALVPRRYHAQAQIDAGHDSYIHLAGTRFGIGPCCADGTAVLDAEALRPRADLGEEPWIVATLAQPPSLVLERQALSDRLHAVSVA